VNLAGIRGPFITSSTGPYNNNNNNYNKIVEGNDGIERKDLSPHEPVQKP
jgi:hypothetical protein